MSARSIRFYPHVIQDREFEDLQKEWYDKLEQEGFVDIEDARFEGRPLKKWSSAVTAAFFMEKRWLRPGEGIVGGFPEPIFTQEEALLNREDFQTICISICRHRNRKLTPDDVRSLWVFYCEGETQRGIAKKINTSKRTVTRIIAVFKEWMKLL